MKTSKNRPRKVQKISDDLARMSLHNGKRKMKKIGMSTKEDYKRILGNMTLKDINSQMYF